jgi:hypothetical protein
VGERYAFWALRELVRLSALATALLAVIACESSSSPPPGAGTESAAGTSGLEGEVSCLDDARVDTYTAGLTKAGAAGELTFKLVASEPAPPAKGGNKFEVSVEDTAGEPASGDLRIALLMPDHGHGTQVTPVVTFDPDTQHFEIAPVYLFMAGVWRVELGLYEDAEATQPRDRATFFFCIEG